MHLTVLSTPRAAVSDPAQKLKPHAGLIALVNSGRHNLHAAVIWTYNRYC